MAVRILVGKIIQLIFGAAIGVFLAALFTGNENYWIALVVGVPLVITFGTIAGAASAASAKKQNPEAVKPGIISSIPGMKIRPQQAVLNPVSAAQPSAGVVLNGELVCGDAPKATDAAVAAPASGTRANPWWWNMLTVLTMAAGAALVLAPVWQVVAWTASDVVHGRPFDGRDMTTGLHQQEAFDAIADRMGGTEVVSIGFFRGSVAVSAPTTPGARTVDRFVWEGGFVRNDGADYSQPDDLRRDLFDAGDIDMSVVADVTRRSIDDAKLQGLDGVYPRIARAFDGGEPQISVALSGSYFDAYFTYSLSGELLDKSGTAFDS